MKKKLLCLVICYLILSSCDINPENVDPIARAIQEKYNSINTYKTSILSGSKEVLRQVKRPDKFKTSLIVHGEPVRIELCNEDTQIYYDTSTPKVTATKVINYDCEGKVSEFFNVFDKIKSIFDFDYVIEETELGGKEVVHLTLSSLDADHDYWTEQFWFDISDYQLIQHSYQVMGNDVITIFDNLELNVEIPDSEFMFEFPGDVQVQITDAHGGTEIPIAAQPPEI